MLGDGADTIVQWTGSRPRCTSRTRMIGQASGMQDDSSIGRRSFLRSAGLAIAAAPYVAAASGSARSGVFSRTKLPCRLRPSSVSKAISAPRRRDGVAQFAAADAGRFAGKVVLVDFWTYTCINWRRSLPYVRAWSEKYRSEGLVVIGVHSPEFSFEKNPDNVRQAVKDERVDYPVALDNDFAIWRAFRNEYWPALYFIDARGHVRHHQFGEGAYDLSESIVQKLLAEAGARRTGRQPVSVEAAGAEAAADWADLQSPECYLGYERSRNFVSPGGAALDKQKCLCRSTAIGPQRMGALRRLDGGKRSRRVEQARRQDRVLLSCPRSASRHGTGGARNARALSRFHRWPSARHFAWSRCR